MKKTHLQKLLILALVTSFFSGVTLFNNTLKSASLSSVSVTLSNPRPSFRGALTSGNQTGSSQVIINTTQNAYPSTSSAQLVEGDVVKIGNAGALVDYTVASTSSLSTFSVTTGLAAAQTDVGDDVIATSSATHTVRFTTANALPNGRFRVLVPALANNGASADGIPDGGFFDFTTSAVSVTCPSDISGYDFVTGTATASNITLNGNDYHVFECAYSGNGSVGTAFDGGANGAISYTVINPAPKSGHTTGTADAYPIVVQHLNSGFTVVDQTAVQVGVIEAVRVTASVPAQITFKILGLPAGTSACGTTSNVPTTPASVPFGEISISSFTDAMQALGVSTNAENGFSVTAVENDQLGKDGTACAGANGTGLNDCIPDAEVVGMTSTATQAWNNAATKGFAYSLHDTNASTTEAFAHGGTFNARHFADAAAAESPVQIFSGTTVADNQNLHVCYRIVAASTTQAGNYENYVTYNAVATF